MIPNGPWCYGLGLLPRFTGQNGAYMTKLAVYLKHFAPRTAKGSLFMPGPITKDSWAAMTAAVGVSADAADGQPARLSVPGIEPVDGTWRYGSRPGDVAPPGADSLPRCAGTCQGWPMRWIDRLNMAQRVVVVITLVLRGRALNG
jgi:hypothetical protein